MRLIPFSRWLERVSEWVLVSAGRNGPSLAEVDQVYVGANQGFCMTQTSTGDGTAWPLPVGQATLDRDGFEERELQHDLAVSVLHLYIADLPVT